MEGGRLDGGVLGAVGLHEDAPRLVPAAGAPAHLLQELVGALGRAEVRQLEDGVCVDHAHHGHIWEVEPLGDHLSAQQHRPRGARKAVEQLFVCALARGGVCVHADDGGAGRHQRAQLVFHALGTRPELAQVGAAAVRAAGGHGGAVPAVVAGERVSHLVVGERHRALGALRHKAAFAAQDEGGKAPLVQQQDGFLLRLVGLEQGLGQRAREHRALPGAKLARHVDNGHGRQGLPAGALAQAHPGPAGRTGVLGAVRQGLDAGGCRAQHQGCPAQARELKRNAAGVVARGGILLVGGLVLFVDDEQAQLRQRCEDGAAGAHHHTGLPASH